MASARVGLRTRLQRWLIGRVRRSRLLPAGIPDKLSDENRLGRAFTQTVMVYFPTTIDSLYQLRPWLPALRALDAQHPVVCVFKDSRVAEIVRDESRLDCVTLARYGQLDEILTLSLQSGGGVKLALYINHDPINFECLRFTSLVHVYLGHGDSDKGVSASNQVKAYDFCFLAGQAALERTTAATILYDAPAHSVLIGQPQNDAGLHDAALHDAGEAQSDQADARTAAPDGRRTVLYCPTWEASQPSVSYGSVERQGAAIVSALTHPALNRAFQVIYRPHPLNGVIRPSYAAADARVRDLVLRAGGRVDTDVPIERSFADADLLITDVSAVTLSWLPTGRPVLVTEPQVAVPPSPLHDVLPRLPPGADVAGVVADHLESDPTAEARASLTEHYLGDTTPGVATAQFLAACSDAIDLRDREWSRAQSRGAVGP